MMCHKIGFPPISTSGLGRNSVSSRRRVPIPPHRITTCSGLELLGIARSLPLIDPQRKQATAALRQNKHLRALLNSGRQLEDSNGISFLREGPSIQISQGSPPILRLKACSPAFPGTQSATHFANISWLSRFLGLPNVMCFTERVLARASDFAFDCDGGRIHLVEK